MQVPEKSNGFNLEEVQFSRGQNAAFAGCRLGDELSLPALQLRAKLTRVSRALGSARE